MADTPKEPFLGYMTVDASGTIITVHPGNPSHRLHASSTLDTQGFLLVHTGGALDHLQHGVTAAFNFNYSNHWGAAPSEKDNVDHQQFRAELASGMRFVHGLQPTAGSHDHSRDH
ncbi:hypothetical protein WH240_14820 [Gluconobacter wancherniae]|uniref:hypothetical protein n=1 Tax=Gluconobacter wancherniae TaxID=1307955 RepID=UPI0030961818